MTSRRWIVSKWLPLLGTAAWLNAQSKKENAVNGKREVRLHNPATLSKPNGYSHVAEVVSGKTVYIAGQVALDKDGRLVGKDDFAGQVRQVFANLNDALKSAGCSFSDVVKLNYYCVDRIDRSQISVVSETRDRFVDTQAPPVSTFVFVRELVGAEWLIEIEAVAVSK
jgi:enamine deaminase RidA (YjgF/YER057c/UK114 family)